MNFGVIKWAVEGLVMTLEQATRRSFVGTHYFLLITYRVTDAPFIPWKG